MAKTQKQNFTTIWVTKENVQRLKEVGKLGESFNDVISRLLSGECDVFVDFLDIDGTPPQDHSIIFRLGDYYYRYDHGTFEPIKQPKIKVVSP